MFVQNRPRSLSSFHSTTIKPFMLLVVIISGLAAGKPGLAQQNLPLIIGSELPGTSTIQPEFSIDGVRMDIIDSANGAFIADADGDGIVETYLKVKEPDQPCTTLVYLPSKQVRTAVINSSELSQYTRIRNFGVVLDESGGVVCPDESLRLRNFGDLDGDGVDEIATLFSYNGELIVNGAIPQGTLIDAKNPVADQVTLVADELDVISVGDFNGDGLVDWYLSSARIDNTQERTDCLVIASRAGELRRAISMNAIEGEVPLAALTRNEIGDCPQVTSAGDVNGDGVGDIVIFDSLSDDGGQWLVNGKTQGTLGNNYRDEGYRIFRTCNSEQCQHPVDFDADGFDDLIMIAPDVEDAPGTLFDGTGSLIVYGGPDGLLSADTMDPLPPGRVTQIIRKYRNPIFTREFQITNQISNFLEPARSTGDVNGDGATDILIKNTSSANRSAATVIFGTPGQRPAVLIEASVDGGNGFLWSEENPFRVNPAIGDIDGDGSDDLAYVDKVLTGAVVTPRAADPLSLTILDGPDSLDVQWQKPIDASSVEKFRVIINSIPVADISADKPRVRIQRVPDRAVRELRIQSIDANDNVIGEQIRNIDLISDELINTKENFADVEFDNTGEQSNAAVYTVTSKSYSSTLGEIFWNSVDRTVLIWRNGRIIDRVKANSYMVQSGEFFITTDYLKDLPINDADAPFTSGTLRRSNLVTVNTTRPTEPAEPSAGDTLPALAAPANLKASIYSSKTVELFWDRAPLSEDIVSYDIARDGTVLGQSQGTSFLDDKRDRETAHVYSITAITRDGTRSAQSDITIDSATQIVGEPAAALPLTGLVYSGTALELFWEPETLAGEKPARYEIFRNGVSVNILDARSFFMAELTSGNTYRFIVVGLDASGTEVTRSKEIALNTL